MGIFLQALHFISYKLASRLFITLLLLPFRLQPYDLPSLFFPSAFSLNPFSLFSFSLQLYSLQPSSFLKLLSKASSHPNLLIVLPSKDHTEAADASSLLESGQKPLTTSVTFPG
jgi:hypothetical protein